MDFKNWLLTEMPITKWELQGNWKRPGYGYNRQDHGILTSPKAVAKIHKKWSNTKQNFEFYFVRTPNHRELQEYGPVTPEFLKEKLGLEIPANPDAITIVFVNNLGAEKIPMTGWMIAHRLGHTIRRKNYTWEQYIEKEIAGDFTEILKDGYGVRGKDSYGGYGPRNFSSELRALFHAVGTMKSAQNRALFSPNEFYYELLAQYLIQGKIKFKPLPQFLILKNHVAWGRPNPQGVRLPADKYEDFNDLLQANAEKYDYYYEIILDGLIGEIFLM